MKVLLILLFISINCITDNNETFDKMIKDLSNLEKYIREYIKEKSYTEKSLTHLITCYIRLGAYTTSEWSLVAGDIPDDLISYVKAKDKEQGTSAESTQSYRDTLMPNGETMDFVHMFAVMNGIENGNSYSGTYAHLVGWGGDTEQLLEDIMNTQGDLDYLMKYIKDNYFMIKGGFDGGDLISDLDGPILLKDKNDNNNFADLIKNYYTTNKYKSRVKKFVDLTFPNLVDKVNKETFRSELYNIYNSDIFIKVLECQKGLRDPGLIKCYSPSEIKEQYLPHQKAAVFVVSDYFVDNYDKGGEDEKEEEEEEKGEEEHKKEEPKSDIPDSSGNKGSYQTQNFIYFICFIFLIFLLL